MFNEYPKTQTNEASYVALFSGVGVSYLPAANTEQEAHDIALLLLLQLLEVLVGAHLCKDAILANASKFAQAGIGAARKMRSADSVSQS